MFPPLIIETIFLFSRFNFFKAANEATPEASAKSLCFSVRRMKLSAISASDTVTISST
ncbi:hypothetical protein D3C80_1634580 [compost metagenome]